MFDLTSPIYRDAGKAREYLESVHWPNGPVCPRCGETERVKRLGGKTSRPGVVMCNPCRRTFTVTVGTVFEDSKIPLHKWLLGFRLMAGSKKGISAHQLHRSLSVTYKTAWFMAHRIREAMRSGDLAPFGSGGGIVEADETFIGKEPYAKNFSRAHAAFHHKMKVLALVDRDTGRSRAFVVDAVAVDFVVPILRENIAREARMCTDDHGVYRRLRKDFAEHGVVRHSSGEYGRGEVHTNTIEGYFSIFKRGMKGVYQHCGKQHLHRYLAEFDFRYSNRAANGIDDAERTETALKGAQGRRLTYRRAAIAA
jgi:transposase-like protein